MTVVEVKKLIAVLSAIWGDRNMPPERSAAYERALVDLDYEPANIAAERLMVSCKFLPSIAELREATFAAMRGERRMGCDAWGDVLKAVSEYGYYRVPVFRDPVVARCVQAMTWQALCLSENQTSDRARFIELYDGLAEQWRVNELATGLPAHSALAAALARKLTGNQ